MASPPLTKIDPACIAAMGFANGKAQSVFIIGYGNKMYVIGHQAICPDRHPVPGTPLTQNLEVVLIVFFRKEGLLSPVSPLGDVMRQAGGNNSSDSGHVAY
jgi:subtilisin family serine protease